MKTILRNFLTTLRRFKMASILNILGLSAAFTAFLIIMMQVYYERTFDTCYKDSGRIYRISKSFDGVTYSPILSRPLFEAITEGIPQVEKATFGQSWQQYGYFTVDHNGSKVGFKEVIGNFSKRYPEVFGFEFVDGSLEAYQKPNTFIISESISEKLFGSTISAGKIISIPGDSTVYEIAGVYRDLPDNCCVTNAIISKIGENENKTAWGNNNYLSYVVLAPGVDPEEVSKLMMDQLSKVDLPDWMKGNNKFSVKLFPLEDIYYLTGQEYDPSPKGNKTSTDILFVIALLVVVIAAINFVNFSTSLTPIRIKSINTQKVLGSPVSTLRAALVFEAIGIALISFLLALLWTHLISQTGLSAAFISKIDIAANPIIVFATLALALVTGFMSGIYPAIYTTSFPPALVLKGSFGMSPKGRRLRTGLIGFQFVVSIALIIAATFLQLQNTYLRNFNSGMDTEEVAMVSLDYNIAEKYKESLVNKLKSSPLIEDVAFAQFRFGSSDLYMSWGRNFRGDESINFWCMPVSYNFPEVMGLEITDGRSFSQSDEIKAGGTYLMNEALRKKYKLTLDERITGHNDNEAEIAGFIKDFNFMSLRKGIEPMTLYVFGASPWMPLTEMYIKTKGNPYEAVEHIKKSIAEFDPYYPTVVDFFDTVFDEVYKKEQKTSTLIMFFSLLAVIISLVGVFGLVVFETQFRRKEIGVRKVHGATVGEILAMFNKSFMRIVLICFVVAAPLAWYGVTKWLETFAYRTPVYWWVFVVALLIVMVITIVTVTVQSWKAATENPVKSIKSE